MQAGYCKTPHTALVKINKIRVHGYYSLDPLWHADKPRHLFCDVPISYRVNLNRAGVGDTNQVGWLGFNGAFNTI